MHWTHFGRARSAGGARRSTSALLLSTAIAALIFFPAVGSLVRVASASVAISENFATSAAAADFTVISGGAWTSGNYVFTLVSPASQQPAIGNANIVVHNTAVTGDWSLAVRMSATGSATAQPAFSVVFGFQDATHYFYANASRAPGAGANGIYEVWGATATQLTSFASAAQIVSGRNYDVALTRTGSTVSMQMNGTPVGSATSADLRDPMRIGFGSQGSVVTARHLSVSGGGTLPSSTATPAPTAMPSPTSTPSPTPDPTAAPTPDPTATPTPTPTPSPSPSSACTTGAFPTAFFAPGFSGPPTRVFSQQFISEQPDGSFITTCYPVGSSSPSSGVPGGAQAKLSISSGPRLSYTLTYQLRFPTNFQFVKGGKLPGLCGGQCWTGSNNGPGGWTTRYMWRSGGQGEVLLSDATTTGYGTDLGLGSWNFAADGQWHTIAQTVTMNTPGTADGSVVVHYDGAQVANFTGITFRAAGDTDAIDSLMFCTFYGGSDSSWGPTATMHADFRGFTAS